MNIAIIGAGFAGLSSALFLSEKNHVITIFDKFSELKIVGAGIMIQPSSMVILKKLGLYEDLLKHGEKIKDVIGLNHHKKQVFGTHYNDYEQESFGIGIHRSILFDCLLQACYKKTNIQFILGKEIDSLFTLKTSYDLVIVANGSHSKLRQELPISQYYKPYPYGCAWTTVEDEMTTKYKLQQYVHYSTEMFGLLPSGYRDGKRLLSVFWSLPVSCKDNYSKETMFLAMEKHHADPELMSKIKQSDFAFAVYADIWMKQFHYENVVVIGDAAHGMNPQLGQGANMALLDSYFLSEILDSNNIEKSLAIYTKTRKPHIRFYCAASKFLTPLFQSKYIIWGIIRDYLFSYSQKFKMSRFMSSQILSGTRLSWWCNKKLNYIVKK